MPKTITLETILEAVMVVDKKVSILDERVDRVETRLDKVELNTEMIRDDISDILDATRKTFTNHEVRLKSLEHREFV